MLGEFDFSDDIELDLDEIDRLQTGQSAQRTARSVTPDGAQQLAEVNGRVQYLNGENAILRSNLARKDESHQREIDRLLSTQAQLKESQAAAMQRLQKQVEQLKTERKFLANEVQDAAMLRSQLARRGSPHKQAHSSQSPSGPPRSPSRASHASPEASPSKTAASRKRARIDLEASFRDGFDTLGASFPAKRAQRVQVSRPQPPASPQGNHQPTSRHSPYRAPRPNDSSGDYLHPEAETAATTNPLAPVYIKAKGNIYFYQLVTNHVMPCTDQNSMELLGRHADFRDPSVKISTCLQKHLMQRPEEQTSPVADFASECIVILTQSITASASKEPLEPCCVLLALLELAFSYDPRETIGEVIEICAQMLIHLIGSNLPFLTEETSHPYPKFRSIRIPKAQARRMCIVLYSLDVLETLSSYCATDASLQRRLWTTMSHDFILNLLSSKLPVNVTMRAIRIVTCSISDTSFGHINAQANWTESQIEGGQGVRQQKEQEMQIMDTLTRAISGKAKTCIYHLFVGIKGDVDCSALKRFTPSHVNEATGNELDLGYKHDEAFDFNMGLLSDALHLASSSLIVRFFTGIALRRGASVIVEQCQFLPTLVQVVARELDEVYWNQGDHTGSVRFIGSSIRLIHATWNLYPNAQTMAQTLFGSVHDNVVAIAQIALSDDGGERPLGPTGFDADIVGRAKEILEQTVTYYEAEDIHRAMYPTEESDMPRYY